MDDSKDGLKANPEGKPAADSSPPPEPASQPSPDTPSVAGPEASTPPIEAAPTALAAQVAPGVVTAEPSGVVIEAAAA
ncbi:MAG TPA: hypothetical protein VKU44_06265, partial [Terriglobia bacterium]|nr:hypothetical protein [Terriglobia bacterium]